MVREPIILEAAEMRELTKRVRSVTVAVRDRQRAQIILLAAQGRTQESIGETVGVTRVTVNHWCRRFAKARLVGLSDAPGRGRKPSLPVLAVQKVIETAGQPPATRGRWSCRSMAQAAGIRHIVGQRSTPVGRQRHQAAPVAYLQVVQRCALRREVLGRHRLVPEPAREGHRALL
jgi:hypothetical protein